MGDQHGTLRGTIGAPEGGAFPDALLAPAGCRRHQHLVAKGRHPEDLCAGAAGRDVAE